MRKLCYKHVDKVESAQRVHPNSVVDSTGRSQTSPDVVVTFSLAGLQFSICTIMPRRPSKSKGANKSSARPLNRAEGKIKRWDKLSDIPMDEEDQCMFVLLHRNVVY